MVEQNMTDETRKALDRKRVSLTVRFNGKQMSELHKIYWDNQEPHSSLSQIIRTATMEFLRQKYNINLRIGISKFRFLIIKWIKRISCDGIWVIMDAFEEGILVEIFNQGLNIVKKVVFSVRSMVIDGYHKADMADVTRHLERAGRVARLASGQAP